MKELTDSAKIAQDAIDAAKDRLDISYIAEAGFVLAYAALRILANIADQLSEIAMVEAQRD